LAPDGLVAAVLVKFFKLKKYKSSEYEKENIIYNTPGGNSDRGNRPEQPREASTSTL
jgi:hypothetical protein